MQQISIHLIVLIVQRVLLARSICIYKKMRMILHYPKPVFVINNNKVKIFSEGDIIKYESKHKELADKKSLLI